MIHSDTRKMEGLPLSISETGPRPPKSHDMILLLNHEVWFASKLIRYIDWSNRFFWKQLKNKRFPGHSEPQTEKATNEIMKKKIWL